MFAHDCVCWFWLLLFLLNNSDFTVMVLPQLKAAAVWPRIVYTALCFRPPTITLFMPPFSHANPQMNTRAFHLLKKIIIVFPSLHNWLVSCSTLRITEMTGNGGEIAQSKGLETGRQNLQSQCHVKVNKVQETYWLHTDILNAGDMLTATGCCQYLKVCEMLSFMFVISVSFFFF